MAIKLNGTNTEASPAFTGDDTDTGLQCGTNELSLVTGGSKAVTVDSSQQVGIGTSSPSSYGGAVKLAAVSAGNTALSIASGTSSDGTLFFADGTSGDATYRGSVKYAHSSDSMQFSTAAGERVRILSGGGITFNGDTAAANALDDYEEGTFTPEFANAASGGTASSSYTTQDGRYTKIGNLVHIDIYLQNVDVTGLGSSQFFIRGLPFGVRSGSIYIGLAGLSRADLNSTASSLYAFANATAGSITAIRVFQSKDNAAHSAIPCDALTDENNEIFITMTYPAA